VSSITCENCQKLFCTSCASSWKQKNNTCPMRCGSFEIKPENKQIKEIRELFKAPCDSCSKHIPLGDYKAHSTLIKCDDCIGYLNCLSNEHRVKCLRACPTCNTKVSRENIDNKVFEENKQLKEKLLQMEVSSLSKDIHIEALEKKLISLIPNPNDEYIKLSEDNFKTFQDFVNRKWIKWEKSGGYESFYINEVNGLCSVKSKCVIRKSLKRVFEFLAYEPNKANYDSLYESGKLLKELDENHSLYYEKYKPHFNIESRDYLIIKRNTYSEEGESIILATSFVSSLYPKYEGITRGEIIYEGFVLKKRGANETLVEFYSNFDPKLPQWLVNMCLKALAGCILKAKEVLEKN